MGMSLHMLATMSANPQTVAPRIKGPAAFVRSEYPLFVGLATTAIFLALGNQAVEDVSHPYAMAAVFVWLFVGVLWSAISVVRHADCLALKCGEPYGTLILTLSAITIEVMMISAAMLHGANNPTLARDMMFAVLMIALNGLVGLSLLLGGLRYREQHYNIQGTSAYLNAIMALSVLGLVLPNYTTSLSGPRFSAVQELFLVITSLSLYAIFLLIQTKRHSEYFMESQSVTATADAGDARRWLAHAEGAIAKQRSAPYRPGERKGMVKVKRVRTIDAVVVGWRPGKEPGTVGALILGLYDGGELRVVGHCSGLTAKEKRRLVGFLAPYESGERGSADPSRWSSGKELEWGALRPELVVEIDFDHVSAGRIRHGAKLRRWREDKPPMECTFEQLAS